MKLMKRTGCYVASNCGFDPQTMEAHSYNWWKFVRKINGKVVFNEYRYSVTTAKHQSKVLHLLNELGIKIDITVRTSRSLSEFKTIKEVRDAHTHALKVEAEVNEIKRRNRNTKARLRRLAKKSGSQSVSATF